MGKSIMELVAEAKAAVPAIGAGEAAAAMGRDDVVIVDVREDGEVAELGIIKGAIHASRGMIEFRADETSPMHHPSFSKDKTTARRGAYNPKAKPRGKLSAAGRNPDKGETHGQIDHGIGGRGQGGCSRHRRG